MITIIAMIDVIEIGAVMKLEETEIDTETEIEEVVIGAKEIEGGIQKEGIEIGIQIEIVREEVIMSLGLKMNLGPQG